MDTALYKIQVQTETTALDGLQKNIDSLQSAHAIPIKADTAGALASVESLKAQTAGLAKDALVHVGIDSTQATQGIHQLSDTASSGLKPIREWEQEVLGAKQAAAGGVSNFLGGASEKVRDVEGWMKRLKSTTADALNPEAAEKFKHQFESIGEKAKGAISGLGAGFLAGGIAVGLEKGVEAAKKTLESQERLRIALRQTGAEGEALDQKFKESEAITGSLASMYAKSKGELRALATEVAGLGGISGPQAKKVTEIGIAFEQIGIPAKALKAVIRGAADPESAAALDALKSKFPALAGALSGAGDAGAKMDAIYKTITPTLEGMKEAADGPLGQMTRMEQTGKALQTSLGLLIFSALQPLVPVLTAVASIVSDAVIPGIKAVTGFVSDNQTAIAVLAVGVGVLALSMNAAAAGTAALGIAQKAQAVATGIVTGAQTLLNVVMNANPIAFIVAGIAGLAAGAIYLYDHVKPVHDAFDQVWVVLKGLSSFIGTFIQEYIGGLTTAFSGVGKVISGLVSLDFDQVSEGAAQVGKGVGEAFAGSASKGMSAMHDKIREGTAALKQEGEAGKEAGEKIKSAAEEAAAAQQKITTAAQAGVDAFNEQQKGLSENVSYIEKQIAEQTDLIRQKQAIVRSGSAEERAQAQRDIEYANQQIGLLKEVGQKRFDLLQQIKKEDADSKFGEKKQQQEDLLAKAKQIAEEKSHQLELDLRQARAQQGIAFSSKDELDVEQKKNEVFKQQVDQLHLLNEKKYASKARLEIQTGDIKELELQAKIKLDQQKAQEELDKAIAGLTNKEIELGIRPKSDSIALLNQTIDHLQQELKPLEASVLINGHSPELDTRIANMKSQILDAQASIQRITLQGADSLEASRLDIMKDGLEKELRAEQDKFDQSQRQFLDFQGNQRSLTAEELELRKNLEEKHAQNVLAIQKKYHKEGFNYRVEIEKGLNTVLDTLWQTAFRSKKEIDQADLDDKRLNLDKQQQQLQRSLQKGELSERDYKVKLEKLTSDRAKLEKGLEDDKWEYVRGLYNTAYADLSKAAEGYFNELVSKYILDALFHSNAENQKTLSTQLGTTARITSNGAETASNVTNANSSLLGAVADEIAKAISFLGPIAGPIAGLATAGLLMASMAGFKSVLGLAVGGVMVGEKGPEIVSPAKEYAQYSASLVTGTMKTVLQYLNKTGQGGIGTGRMAVDVRGRLIQRGRDQVYSFERETRSRKTERLVTS